MSASSAKTQPQETGSPPAASRVSERATYLLALAIFVLAAALTLHFNRSMSGDMSMPGNWSMSMMWMPMAGQTWFEAALLFVAMWLAMMVAMMLPSVLPMLLLYRRAVAFRGERHLGALTFVLASGYFFIWTLFGILAYVGGVTVSSALMNWPALGRFVPLTAGAALVVAGAYQLTPLKSACLRHCRNPLLIVARHLHGGWKGSLFLGLHHGAFCAACCWGLMLIQLVLGVMNLAVMAAVALVIASEKILARGEFIARLTGAAAIFAGLAFAASSFLRP